jgi:hypothetical protein
MGRHFLQLLQTPRRGPKYESSATIRSNNDDVVGSQKAWRSLKHLKRGTEQADNRDQD